MAPEATHVDVVRWDLDQIEDFLAVFREPRVWIHPPTGRIFCSRLIALV